MKTTFLLATLFVSVWMCSGSEHRLLNSQRRRRSISESARFHNEYHRSDRDSVAIPPSTSSTPSCVPGTKWKNDCNNCWCLATGAVACTLLKCPNFTIINNGNGRRTVSLNSIHENNGKHSRVRRADDDDDTSCIPGTTVATWKRGCNTCWCTDAGNVACTIMRCTHVGDIVRPSNAAINNRQRRSNRSSTNTVSELPCKNGTRWFMKCNSCRCLNGHAACTRMRCRDD
ncbi:hypothetical protein HA402_008196 [Bradysia odoriphaga]|nr:hypothetical protein HA402_008196 [Bradysia odoriphaga]